MSRVRLEPLTLSTKLSLSVLIIALNLTIDVSSLAERPFMGRRVRSGPLMRAIDERNAIKQPSAIAPRTSRSAIFHRTSFNTCDDTFSLVSLVSAGLGIGFASEWRGGLRILILEPAIMPIG
ncbi:hypothetical protein ASD00_29620 [Ensifer sp. Root31]|nr:hypothetical protein ASD00_29620 [Ensifer sp. Root31]